MRITPFLRIRPENDVKWRRRDLRDCVDPVRLQTLWNELIFDGELTLSINDGLFNANGVLAKKGLSGHYYCGQRTLKCLCCGDNICGPKNGCNCSACCQLDMEEEEILKYLPTEPPVPMDKDSNSSSVHLSWIWGSPPRKFKCRLYIVE